MPSPHAGPSYNNHNHQAISFPPKLGIPTSQTTILLSPHLNVRHKLVEQPLALPLRLCLRTTLCLYREHVLPLVQLSRSGCQLAGFQLSGFLRLKAGRQAMRVGRHAGILQGRQIIRGKTRQDRAWDGAGSLKKPASHS